MYISRVELDTLRMKRATNTNKIGWNMKKVIYVAFFAAGCMGEPLPDISKVSQGGSRPNKIW